MKKHLKKILIGLVVLLALAQLIRVDKENPEVNLENDIFTNIEADTEIQSLIKNSCYDCHSNESTYPWYSDVAPISWILKDHIVSARETVNFSEWSSYSDQEKTHKLLDCAEALDDGEMPMIGYIAFHDEANLSDEDRKKLIYWLKQSADSKE